MKARKYAVIPLSEQSGLIQWVDGTPLYTLYKQWQRREHLAKQVMREASGVANPTDGIMRSSFPFESSFHSIGIAKLSLFLVLDIVKEPAVVRPSDMFYSKIIPALKEKGITNVSSRKDWPIDVLRRVFHELVNETPR